MWIVKSPGCNPGKPYGNSIRNSRILVRGGSAIESLITSNNGWQLTSNPQESPDERGVPPTPWWILRSKTTPLGPYFVFQTKKTVSQKAQLLFEAAAVQNYCRRVWHHNVRSFLFCNFGISAICLQRSPVAMNDAHPLHSLTQRVYRIIRIPLILAFGAVSKWRKW